jgi:hypothetical protein
VIRGLENRESRGKVMGSKKKKKKKREEERRKRRRGRQ